MFTKLLFSGYKWDKNVITWKPTRYSRKLTPATQRYNLLFIITMFVIHA